VLLGVEVFQFTQGKLSQVIQAERANYEEQGWVLQQVRIQSLGLARVSEQVAMERLLWQEERQEQTQIHFPFEPETLQLMAQEKKNWSIVALTEQIEVLANNGMQTQILELALWRKFAHPISILAMLVIAVPLLLRAGRSASMGGRILMGIVIGLSFFLLNRVVGDMTALAELPPLVSAMALPVSMLLIGFVWLKKMR
jgi:lipopolysaccharide export system permease protein